MSDQTISKYNYFIGALKAKAHYAREWMIRAFSVSITPVKDAGNVEPWTLRHDEDAVRVYVPDGDSFSWKVLEGVKPLQIPYVYHEVIGPIKAGDVENLTTDLQDSTWGTLLFNSRVLVYATGSTIPFQQGPIDIGSVEKIFAKKMEDDPAELPGEPGKIYVYQWQRFGKAIADLAGYEFFVPSVSDHALQAPPGHRELRDELLKKYEGQLDDPVIQSRIQDELVAQYKDYLKGDPSEGFIYKKKSLNTALKRMFLIHGPEAGFDEGGRAKLVINSLNEGIDFDNYPAMVNSLRAGSYYRGALTALAGEDVDLTGRAFQNSRIDQEFCGTTETLDEVVDKNEHLFRYLDIKGERVLLTEENIGEYHGQNHGMYSPAYCKKSRGDVCSICIGQKLAAHENSLAAMVSNMPSTMMLIMMGSAHAKELKTTPLDVENFLR